MEEKTGIKQQAISRLENPYYGKATLTTLKRIAAAFDVGLLVEFVPFSQLINRVSGTPYIERGFSPDTMNVPSFDEEEARSVFAPQDDFPSMQSIQLGSAETPGAAIVGEIIGNDQIKWGSKVMSRPEADNVIWQRCTGTEIPFELPSQQGKVVPLPLIPSQAVSGARPQTHINLGGSR